MSTLLLRLAAPMQSWGTQSRFYNRDTDREPSKSGVIGLLCAALGRPRGEAVSDLSALRMGVRIDREGELKRDYHTAWRLGEKHAVVSPRYYLSDAAFLVALEGGEDLLKRLNLSLASPIWQLYLGRKSFPPTPPIRVTESSQADSLEDALARWPLLERRGRPGEVRVRAVIEGDSTSTSEVRTDVPVSFEDRTFVSRYVQTTWLEVAR